MKTIGLTGSIAMGKSEVAKILNSIGIPVFDSDAEVHKLYDSKKGADLIATMVPEAIVDGKVSRQILSTKVLADPQLLTRLERLVHAEIKTSRESFLDLNRKQGCEFAVLDIPLLFETGAEDPVDVVMVVSSTPEIQHERALSRPGMTPQKLAMILARQMPDLEKRKRADYIIENNGSKDELRQSVLSIIAELRKQI